MNQPATDNNMNNTAQPEIDIRCALCEKEYYSNDPLLKNIETCPNCNTKWPPCRIDEDVNLKINWFDLRLLANFAVRWSDSLTEDEGNARAVLQAVLKRISQHRPKDAPALTIYQEVKELQQIMPNSMLVDDSGEIILPPKENPEEYNEPPETDPDNH